PAQGVGCRVAGYRVGAARPRPGLPARGSRVREAVPGAPAGLIAAGLPRGAGQCTVPDPASSDRITSSPLMRVVTTPFPNSRKSPRPATTSVLMALPPQVQPFTETVAGDSPSRSNQPPQTQNRPS